MARLLRGGRVEQGSTAKLSMESHTVPHRSLGILLATMGLLASTAAASNAAARDNIPITDLLKTLAHPDHAERMRAQRELADRGKEAIAPLKSLLADKSQKTSARIHALWALFAIAERHADFDPTPAFVTALHNGPDDLRAQAARAIGSARLKGEGVVKGLIHRARNDKNAFVRMYAAAALGRIGDKAAATDLLASLDDEDEVARFAKVLALRVINAWDTAPAFLNAAEERVRQGAVWALTGVYDETAVAALAQAAMENPYNEVRIAAIEALAQVHRTRGWVGRTAANEPRPRRVPWASTDKVAATLRLQLTDANEKVRIAAIRAQEKMQDGESLATLRELAAKDASAAVRQEAKRVLEAVDSRNAR